LTGWVDIDVVAEYTGRSKHTIRKLCQRGLMPHGRSSPGRRGHLLFNITEVDQYLRQCGSVGRVEQAPTDDERTEKKAAEIADDILAGV